MSDSSDPPPPPPDRSHLLTEQRNPRTMNLHSASVADCVRLIGDEDRVVLVAVEKARPQITAFIEAIEPRFLAGGRLIYLGAGTSGRLGVLDASEAPPTFQLEPGRIIGIIAGGDASLRKSSEGKEDDPRGAETDLAALQLTPLDTVLGIAAGGTTPYVLGALTFVKQSPRASRPIDAQADRPQTPLTGLLTCAPVARPADADQLIVLETGGEVLTGSTRMKAGTATKLVLNTISTTLMVRSGRVFQNLMVDLRATNAKLRDRAARIIAVLTGLPRDAAFALLDRAGGSVKTAVAMHALGVDRLQAESRLNEVRGRLGDLIRAAPGR